MSDERCETCRFWARDEADDAISSDAGNCRRYPPEHNHAYGIVRAFEGMLIALYEGTTPFDSASATMEWQYANYPGTEAHWWCGEHQRIPLPVVPPA